MMGATTAAAQPGRARETNDQRLDPRRFVS